MTIMVVLRMNNLPNFPKGQYNSGLVLDFYLFMEKVWRVEKAGAGTAVKTDFINDSAWPVREDWQL